MKLRKIFAGMSALAVTATMAVSASAMDFEKEQSAGISMQFNTDVSTVAEWEDTASSITDFELGTAFDITVDLGEGNKGKPANYFAIETGLKGDEKAEFVNAETGENTLKYDITVNSIKADGADVKFDASGLDVHVENGVYRAEFFKSPDWGGKASAVNTEEFPEFTTLVVNVTITEKGAAPETPETTETPKTTETPETTETPKTTDTPSTPAATPTGASAGLALAGLALAGAAIVVSKRK